MVAGNSLTFLPRERHEWVAMDIDYIQNWSLWLDLKILFRTVFVVLAGSGK